MAPRVSILLPSHRSRFLAEAMASVFAQTSTDYQLLVDHYPGAPLGDRLNRLASIASGEWLVILCDDDTLCPQFLERVTPYLTDAADVVYTDCYAGADTVARMRPWTLEAFKSGPPCWITSLVRTSMWRRLGGHDGDFEFHDYDFWMRCFKADARAKHVAEPLWRYRVHEGQWSHAVNRPVARARMLARHPELA